MRRGTGKRGEVRRWQLEKMKSMSERTAAAELRGAEVDNVRSSSAPQPSSACACRSLRFGYLICTIHSRWPSKCILCRLRQILLNE